MEYAEVMDAMYKKAEEVGLKQKDTSWLMLDGVWVPNPHYRGEPVGHPECPDCPGQFNPPKE